MSEIDTKILFMKDSHRDMIKPDKFLIIWLQAVKSGSIENIMALYDKNALLIPTFSNKVLNTPSKIKDYFVTLQKRRKLNVKLHPKTVHLQRISDTVYSVSGIYQWQFEVENELLSFEARFSFVFDINKKSPIINHHSSQVPRMI